MRKILLIIIFLTASNNAAHAFDCKKASTETEKMICSDKELIKADAEMNKVYQEVYQNFSNNERQALKKVQAEWTKWRDYWGDNESRLREVIVARKDFLEIWIKPEVIVSNKNYRIKRVYSKDKATDISYPELLDLKDSKITKIINLQILESKLEINCDGAGELSDTAEVTLLNSHVFSCNGSASGYCEGNAHPFSANYGVVYDIRTGKKLELEDVINSKDGEQSPELVKLLKTELKKSPPEAPPEAECMETYTDDRLKDMFFSFYFDKSGNLVLIPIISHGAVVCLQEFTLGKSNLGSLVKADGVMSRF